MKKKDIIASFIENIADYLSYILYLDTLTTWKRNNLKLK